LRGTLHRGTDEAAASAAARVLTTDRRACIDHRPPRLAKGTARRLESLLREPQRAAAHGAPFFSNGKSTLAKTNYQFERRQRDLAKKKKKDEKRLRKIEKKEQPAGVEHTPEGPAEAPEMEAPATAPPEPTP